MQSNVGQFRSVCLCVCGKTNTTRSLICFHFFFGLTLASIVWMNLLCSFKIFSLGFSNYFSAHSQCSMFSGNYSHLLLITQSLLFFFGLTDHNKMLDSNANLAPSNKSAWPRSWLTGVDLQWLISEPSNWEMSIFICPRCHYHLLIIRANPQAQTILREKGYQNVKLKGIESATQC